MFENLTTKVNAHYDEAVKKNGENLDTMTTGEALLNNWYTRSLMTPAAFQIAQEADHGAPLPEVVKQKMQKRFISQNEKDRKKYLAKLEEAANAREVRAASISVEWSKNATWEKNPTATVSAETLRTYGHASGCGYDKESAAIASAINSNPEIMRILYEHAEAGKEFPCSVTTWAGVPSFDGGCGVSCFRSVFDACGYEWKDVYHGKNADVYELYKR